MSKSLFGELIPLTLDGSGNVTATGNRRAEGIALEIELAIGGMGTPTSITVSVTNTPNGVDRTLLTLSSPSANGIYPVRRLESDNTGADLATYTQQIVDGNIKVVVAGGTAAGTGSVIVRWLQ